jgi:2',3'-cyclic-nucleotide 2'-phosphodiesterase / 3'-nucleotidase / 5'-nucleotidase
MNLPQLGIKETTTLALRRRRGRWGLKALLVLLSLAAFALGGPTASYADRRGDDDRDERDERHGSDAIGLKFLGRYSSGLFGPDESASESLTHDPRTQRLFVVNVANATIDVIDIKKPTDPKFLFAIDLTLFGNNANSVAFHKGVLAVAVEAHVKTDPGTAVFFDAHGTLLNAIKVGALPDMITFTPDGKKVLVANEGEPNDDYTIDPEGSVSIIDVSRGVRRTTQSDVVTADFKKFNNAKLDPSIRIFGPNATVAQDLEPEYITVSKDSEEAWVTLQENNAIAHLDLKKGRFTKLIALGTKDHSLAKNKLDASDRDNAINITNWPLKSFYLPDAVASYEYRGKTYLVTANEGDTRDYDGFSEEARVSSLTLDLVKFPNAADLKLPANLGRLTVTNANGNTDGDDDFDELYATGARSFSIWSDSGKLVFDSGSEFERIIAERFPKNFNADNEANDFDSRSDNKGPEPEGVTIAHLFGKVYAFIALERIGGIMIYNISNPFDVKFVDYMNSRDFTVPVCDQPDDSDCEQGSIPNPAVGDLGAEVVHFIDADDSPTGKPLLAVANEISGTTSLFEIVKKKTQVALKSN